MKWKHELDNLHSPLKITDMVSVAVLIYRSSANDISRSRERYVLLQQRGIYGLAFAEHRHLITHYSCQPFNRSPLAARRYYSLHRECFVNAVKNEEAICNQFFVYNDKTLFFYWNSFLIHQKGHFLVVVAIEMYWQCLTHDNLFY